LKVSVCLCALLVALLLGLGLVAPGLGQASRNGMTIEVLVLRNANLRMGPSLDHAIIGAATAGQWVIVSDQVGDWYQLSTGQWIATFLVAPTWDSRVVQFGSKAQPKPAATPTGATIYHVANLRSGPGTTYPIVGSAQPGYTLDLIGRDQTGEWFILRDGMWIAAFLISGAPTDLPVVDPSAVTPTPTPAPTEPSPTSTSVFLVPPVTPAALRGASNIIIEEVVGTGVVSRVESDEYAVIANRGVAAINIGGWRLNAGNPGQDFIFSNFVLEPGQRIRVYTDEIHPESGGFRFGSGNPLWNNEHDCGFLFEATGTQVSSFCY